MYSIQKHLDNLEKALIPGKAVIFHGARRTGMTTYRLAKLLEADNFEVGICHTPTKQQPGT